MLLLFIGGYHLFGLSGLGYAAIANGLLDAVMSTVMVRWRYGVAYSPLTMAVVAVNALLVAAVMAVTLCVEDNMIKWVAAGVLTLVITINSLIQIKKRTGTWSIRHHR
jgi:peptidoglycan biosynthesis protein MviN/MurJ (putative lipid II flippase)